MTDHKRPEPARRAQLEGLWEVARNLPDAERDAFLAGELADDPILRTELERLLFSANAAEAFFDRLEPIAHAGIHEAMMDSQFDALQTGLAGRYTLEREIGHGGMSTVYLAQDVRHQRQVALKVLKGELAALLGPERFLREIQIAARLRHPHIVPLYDSGETNGFLYYVMPYEPGPSLRDRLTREGALPIDDAARILRDVLEALAYSHQQGIVHRDIKPENVLFSGRHATVTDFGVARAVLEAAGQTKLTQSGVAMGTPRYMSPEQVTAAPHIDQRADIYAVGVLAYELLTGDPPFIGNNLQQVLSAHLAQRPKPVTVHRASVPPELAQLVMKSLEKQPADRWQDADEMLRRLENLTSPVGFAAAVTTRHGSWKKPAIAVTAIVLTAVLGKFAWDLSRAVTNVDPDRVAVVPFENRTGADSLDTFGFIIADMVTNGLTGTGLVRVVAPAGVLAATTSTAGSGASIDPVRLGTETDAGLILSGSYFRVGDDSLRIQANLFDVPNNRPLAPIQLVTVPMTNQIGGIKALQERVTIALASRLDPRLAESAPLSDLPMSLEAYREFAAGMELYWRGDQVGGGQSDYVGKALAHFYRAIDIDSSASALLMAAQAEWAVTYDLPKVDTLLEIVERFGSNLRPLDRAQFDRLRAWLDGDLEGAMNASSRRAEMGFAGADVQDAIRLNRLDEALDQSNAILAKPMLRKSEDLWEWRTQIHHVRGDYKRELREARTGIAEAGENPETMRNEIRALAALGQWNTLRARLDALRSIDATSQVFRDAARELRWHGHIDAARALGEQAAQWYRDALRASPTRALRIQLAETLFDLDKRTEARAMFAALAAESLGPRYTRDHWQGYDALPLGYLGIDAALQNDTVTANAMVDRLGHIQREYQFGINTHWQARIAAALGQCDRAVGLLQRSLKEGRPYAWEVPEFKDLSCSAYTRFMKSK